VLDLGHACGAIKMNLFKQTPKGWKLPVVIGVGIFCACITLAALTLIAPVAMASAVVEVFK